MMSEKEREKFYSEINRLKELLEGQTALAARRLDEIKALRLEIARLRFNDPSSWLEVPDND